VTSGRVGAWRRPGRIGSDRIGQLPLPPSSFAIHCRHASSLALVGDIDRSIARHRNIAKCWVAVSKESDCRVAELQEETVLEVARPGQEKVTLVNVYDQRRGTERPAQKAGWKKILARDRVIVAGDMNAHSGIWNPRAKARRNAAFWEELIEQYDLVVWNSEEATRAGPGATNISIIDLTLSRTLRTGAAGFLVTEEAERRRGVATVNNYSAWLLPLRVHPAYLPAQHLGPPAARMATARLTARGATSSP